MSGAKEVRTKIASVKSTQKITRAMEMVAASKMRKAQQRMAASRPYANRIRRVIGNLVHAQLEYKHPYVEAREVKKVGMIVIATDRGLCGGLNINLFKRTLQKIQEYQAQKIDVELCLIGKKARSFFARYQGKIVSCADSLGDEPVLDDLIGPVQAMITAYDNEEIDKIYVVNNEFVNTMKQDPTVSQLLPLPKAEHSKEMAEHWDYIYEPDAKSLLDTLVSRFVEFQVYQCVVENVACEQAARMVAMKSATDNAGNLIDELQLVHNKARQAAITQELSEITAGAAAV